MLSKLNRRTISRLAMLVIISLFGNIFCYYKFGGSFIFIHSKMIIHSYSDNSTITRKYNMNIARRIYVEDIYVEGFSYPNPQACPSLGKKLKVVLMVISDPGNHDVRKEIRRTWGQNRSDVAVVFVMGTTNGMLLKSLDAERFEFGDLVFARFKEDYRNLTLKSISVMQWVSEYCHMADFLLKVDDDMYINIPRLLEVLYGLNVKQKALYGEVTRWRKPTRQIDSRYFVSHEEYPGDFYPDYLLGGCYMMPASLASAVYHASLTQTFKTMEDVFITGFVAKSLNLKRVNTPGILNHRRIKDDFGSCAVFKVIAILKNMFIGHYKDCKESFQCRS